MTQVRVADPVAQVIEDVAEEKDVSKKAALSMIVQEAGYDV